MKIHSNFTAVNATGVPFIRLLNRDNVSDGAFARVAPLGYHQVIKATNCFATNKLFAELLKMREDNQEIPEALPTVLSYHGKVVRDIENFQYSVWTIERLFNPDEEGAMRQARVLGKKFYQPQKPGYLNPAYRESSCDVEGLKLALHQEQRYCKSPGTWEGCAEIALTMSLRTVGALREAFLFLLEFIAKTRTCLDLLTQGNIMLNMMGQPCLSDPVCAEDGPPLPAQVQQGVCLVVDVPCAIDGVRRLKVEARSSLPLEPEDLNVLESQMAALALVPLRMNWGSLSHRNFLTRKREPLPLWAYPRAAAYLRDGQYQNLFC